MRIFKAGLAIVVWTLAYLRTGSAQVATGLQAYGSFQPSPFDTINEGNLNAHFEIPIVSKAGRGLPFTYTLAYDSSVWSPATANGITSWLPAANLGWSVIGTAATQSATGYVSFTYVPSTCQVGMTGPRYDLSTFSNLQYHDSFSAVHSFPGTFVYNSTTMCGTGTTPLNTPETAQDGSGYHLLASAGGLSPANFTVNLHSKGGAYISAPYSANSSVAGYLTDSNGNSINSNFSGTTTNIVDTLNVTELKVTGAGTPSSPLVLSYPNPLGGTSTYTVNFASYTVQTHFGCSNVSEFGGAGGTTENLVSSVVLPDNTEYSFGYENTVGGTAGTVTGRISFVVLPGNGVINWLYYPSTTVLNQITCTDGSASNIQRVETSNVWKYSHSEVGSNWTSAVTDPAGNETDLSFQSALSAGVIYAFETQRKAYTGTSTSGTLLETLNTCYGASATPCTGTAVSLPISQVSSTLIWPNNLQSRKAFVYDASGNNTSELEYSFGTGAPGGLFRQTSTTFSASLGNIYDHPTDIQVLNSGSTKYAETTFTYDVGGLTTTSGTPQFVAPTTPRGNLTTMAKWTSGTSVLSWGMKYYDNGVLNTVTDPNTSVTTYTSTACGNSFPASLAEPLSLTQSYTWDCNGGVQTSTTDENSQVWTTTFADANFWRPTSDQDPTLATTSHKYTTPLASPGTAISYAESALTFNTTSTQDVRLSLDSLGRLSSSQTKQSPSATNYDSVQVTYDSVGRPSFVTQPYSAAAGSGGGSAPGTTTVYDGLSRPTEITDGGGAWTKYTYMNATASLLQTTQMVEIGPSATGENTKKRQIQYDAFGNVSAVCEVTATLGGNGLCATGLSNGFWTTYSHDVLNNLTGVAQDTQPNNLGTQARSYGYDGLNRMTSETNPEFAGGAINYVYDTDMTGTCPTSNGDLVKRTDPVGNVTCYAYDPLHRLTSVTYTSGPYMSSTPKKTFVYDIATVNGTAMANVKGRLAETYTGPSSPKTTDIGLSYSSRGEVTDTYEATPHTGTSYYHTYSTYWANGLVNTLATNMAGVPTFTYSPDPEGRVLSIAASSGQSPVSTTAYNTASQVTGVTYGSLDADSFGFDPNTARPTSYAFAVNGASETGTIANNTNGTIGKLTILDPFNSVTGQTCSFSYDDLGRLSTDNCGNSIWNDTYTYSPTGNIYKSGTTTFDPTYSSATNRFSTLPAGTPSYDANGNLLNDSFHTYSWDAEGRMVTIDTASFVYDGFDRRVEYGSGSAFSQYYYAPFALHYNVGNATALASPGLRIPLPGGGQANAGSAGVTYYRHPNWQGSQPLNTTPTRTVAADNSFSPFGERYALNNYSGYFAGMLMQYPFMTDGYQADYRMYHEAQSRWVSPDPAGMSAVDPTNPQSWNRYAYAGNNPLSNIDPSGLGNCEPPLYWLPNKNGDGGSCVSGNPSTSVSSPGTCAQALAQSGGAPVAGCPGSPPSGPQTGTGTGAQGNGLALLPPRKPDVFDKCAAEGKAAAASYWNQAKTGFGLGNFYGGGISGYIGYLGRGRIGGLYGFIGGYLAKPLGNLVAGQQAYDSATTSCLNANGIDTTAYIK